MSRSDVNTNLITEKVEKYSDLLLRVAFSYMKNTHDAQDMVQDAFIKVMQKCPLFESEEHERAWLIRVTINLCKNRLKSAWFRKTGPLEEDTLLFTPEEDQVLEVVLELPVKYRCVIQLYYYEGYQIKEIAGILGCKDATVASQLLRARKQLKIKLKEDFDYE